MGRDGRMKRRIPMALDLRIAKLHLYLLTSGTDTRLRTQTNPAIGSMSNPDVGITRDGQGCHHLPPTTSTVGNETNDR